MAMTHEKGRRHNQVLDKWLKEFGWLQIRGSGDDLLMICRDCTKAGKKNAFTSGCKNFQRSALVRRMNQVDHESSAKVLLQQKHFKAASYNANKASDDSLVKQLRRAYWLSKEGMPPTKYNSLCKLQVRNCKIMLTIKIFEFNEIIFLQHFLIPPF